MGVALDNGRVGSWMAYLQNAGAKAISGTRVQAVEAGGGARREACARHPSQGARSGAEG